MIFIMMFQLNVEVQNHVGLARVVAVGPPDNFVQRETGDTCLTNFDGFGFLAQAHIDITNRERENEEDQYQSKSRKRASFCMSHLRTNLTNLLKEQILIKKRRNER